MHLHLRACCLQQHYQLSPLLLGLPLQQQQLLLLVLQQQLGCRDSARTGRFWGPLHWLGAASASRRSKQKLMLLLEKQQQQQQQQVQQQLLQQQQQGLRMCLLCFSYFVGVFCLPIGLPQQQQQQQ